MLCLGGPAPGHASGTGWPTFARMRRVSLYRRAQSSGFFVAGLVGVRSAVFHRLIWFGPKKAPPCSALAAGPHVRVGYRS